jgi:hypothetical protein
MKKVTKALSGASQDAYFRRVLKAYANLSDTERERIVQQLREEVAQLRLRVKVQGHVAAPSGPPPMPAIQAAAAIPQPRAAASARLPFDPYSPNVVVVLRKSGREAALAALAAIDSTENLRLLAREQCLNVDAGVSSAAEMRTAIVMAAERRIANRVAAAG